MSKLKDDTKVRFVSTLVCSGLAVIVNYLISLVLTPYITDILGTDAYGFVTLAKTIANYAIILTTCLNAYSSRYITIAFHKGDLKKANEFYSSVFIANVVLSAIVLLFAAGFVLNLDRFIEVPERLLFDVRILFYLDFINYMIIATGTVFTAPAYIKNRLDLNSIVKIVTYGVEAALLVIFFRNFPPRIFFVGYALVASSIVTLLLNVIVKTYLLPELHVMRKDFSLVAVRQLVLSGLWNSFNSLGNILNSGLDLLISNLMLTGIAMGQLSIVKTLTSIFTILFSTVTQPFHPILLKKYSREDLSGVKIELQRAMMVCGYFSNMLFAGLIGFGLVYYKLWTPNQNIDLLYTVTLVTLIGMVVEGPAFPLLYVYTLTVKNRIPCIITILSGLLNVAGMFILLKFFDAGLYGVVGTTAILAWGTYFVFTPIYSARCLKLRWNAFYLAFIRNLVSAVCITAVVVALAKLISPNSWLGLIMSAGISCMIGLPIHILITATKRDLYWLKNATQKFRR